MFREDQGGAALRLAEAQRKAEAERQGFRALQRLAARRKAWVLFGKICVIGLIPQTLALVVVLLGLFNHEHGGAVLAGLVFLGLACGVVPLAALATLIVRLAMARSHHVREARVFVPPGDEIDRARALEGVTAEAALEAPPLPTRRVALWRVLGMQLMLSWAMLFVAGLGAALPGGSMLALLFLCLPLWFVVVAITALVVCKGRAGRRIPAASPARLGWVMALNAGGALLGIVLGSGIALLPLLLVLTAWPIWHDARERQRGLAEGHTGE